MQEAQQTKPHITTRLSAVNIVNCWAYKTQPNLQKQPTV